MIYILAFLMSITTGLMIFSNPLLAITRFNASALALGMLGTAAAGTYALACAGSGLFVDRLGFRKMLISSCVILLLVFPAIFLVTRLWHLFLLAIFISLGGSFFWPAMMRWVGEEENRDSLRLKIGSFNIALITGVMLGPIIGGGLFPLNHRYPYLLSTLVVVVVLILLSQKRIKKAPRVAILDKDLQWEENSKPIAGFIYIGWLANFASWFAIGASQVLFPKLALALNIKEQVLGLFISLIALGQLAVFAFLRKTHRWHYNFPLLVVFQFLGMGGLLIIYRTQYLPLFAPAFLLIGFAGGMTYFSSLFYSIYRQETKGRKSGFHESFLGLGVALGPIGGGLVARAGNLRAPYLLCIGVFMVSMVVQMIIWQRKPRA